MEPKFVTRDEFIVVGAEFVGKSHNGEIPKLWHESFLPRLGEVQHGVNDGVLYGVCSVVGTGKGECYSYIASREVSSLDDIPEGMTGIVVPACKYAVFTHHGPLETIKDTYNHIYETWLPSSGMEWGDGMDFEYYDARFKGSAEDSEIDLYVPVK